MAACTMCESEFHISCVDEDFLGFFRRSWVLVNSRAVFWRPDPVAKCPYLTGNCIQKDLVEKLLIGAEEVRKRVIKMD